MILDTKNMTLDHIQLSTIEYYFVAALVSNKLVLYKDLFGFVYRREGDKKTIRRYLSNLRNKIQRKIKLDLETRCGFGYILKNIVEVI